MKLRSILLTALAVAAGMNSLLAQHSHLNAGASAQTQDAPLIFANGDELDAASGFEVSLELAADGVYSGYYQGGLTFTSLPGTGGTGGPDPEAAAPGAMVAVQMIHAAGPEGGVFAFWETGSVAPTYEIATGASGTHQWLLSESDGSPGVDPFGHIHGRRWTASRPGVYDVDFRLIDVSTNGVGGKPVHLPSEPLTLRFVAGDGEESVVVENSDFVVGVELQEGAPVAVLRAEDGHSGHAHDPLDMEKHLFRVGSHLRGHIDFGKDHLGSVGSRKWELPAKPADTDGHSHASTILAAHAHPNTLEWNGDQNPLAGLRVVKDAVKGWNVFIDTEGFTFSPENAGGAHVSGEGHAHIYIDGVKLGRVYGGAYYLATQAVGQRVVRVTLNANTHADYSFAGQPVEASVTIDHPEETGHSHSQTIVWEGEVKPSVSLALQPDPVAGWNLLLGTDGFLFAPDHASGDHVPGEGHAHIYINGTKLTRLYGHAYHLGSLPSGVVTVRVGLSANNHADYTFDGVLLGHSVVVLNGEQTLPSTSPTLGISAVAVDGGVFTGDELTVSLDGVHGPGAVALLSGDASSHHAHPSSRVLANSSDGLGGGDVFQVQAGGFVPVAWFFSAPGDYVVSLKIEAELSGGGEWSSVVDVRFQVDPSTQLEHAFIDGWMHLTWDSGQALERSATIGGAFEALDGMHGHFTVEPGGGSAFFRLKDEQPHTHNP